MRLRTAAEPNLHGRTKIAYLVEGKLEPPVGFNSGRQNAQLRLREIADTFIIYIAMSGRLIKEGGTTFTFLRQFSELRANKTPALAFEIATVLRIDSNNDVRHRQMLG
ncbi:hypothetical protein A3840_13995 [Devosia elaeis]|uniref:Uncharacterized protein n=1 Tax=Devosia elaeis TaxID=1770058 RepID=A0A178HSU4_9HYPH|nr:hypothetical protein A3840_13995 [Devosia elaeis]